MMEIKRGLSALALLGCSACAQQGGDVPYAETPLSAHTLAIPTGVGRASHGTARRRTQVPFTIIVYRKEPPHIRMHPGTGSTFDGNVKKPSWISPSTQSVTVALNGGAPQPYNIGPYVPGCTQYSSDELMCTIDVDVSTGDDSFDVRLYDQANGGGNLLGVGDTTATVSTAPAQIEVTIEGVISSMHLSLSTVGGPMLCGTSQGVPLTVQAFDADHNQITSDDYYNPISLTIGGNQFGAVSVNPSVVPAPTTSVSLSFSGGPASSTVTINATADGATPASVSFDPENYRPLNATYNYIDSLSDQVTETVSPATSLPGNFLTMPTSGPLFPVSFSNIPTTGLCDVKTVIDYVNGGYGVQTTDDYVGLSTNYGSSDGRTAEVLYLEFASDDSGPGWQLSQWETYYPKPVPIDLLPEQTGDNWSADPSYAWAYGEPLGDDYYSSGAIAEYGAAVTPTETCDITNKWSHPAYYAECGPTDASLTFSNAGPQDVDTYNCPVGPSIPTAGNALTETITIRGPSRVTYYDADGVGTICAGPSNAGGGQFNNTYGESFCVEWCALQSASTGSDLRRIPVYVKGKRSSAVISAFGVGLHALLHTEQMRRKTCDHIASSPRLMLGIGETPKKREDMLKRVCRGRRYHTR